MGAWGSPWLYEQEVSGELSDRSQHEQKGITKAFEDALNRQGYSFQYSVLKKAEELFDQRKSAWVFQVAEFPVAVQGRNTHIDFVMTLGGNKWHDARHGQETPVYLVAECKRANPALNRWCFARAPFVSRGSRLSKPFIVERIQIVPTGGRSRFKSGGSVLDWSRESYHIGLVVRSEDKNKGDGSTPHGREVIEKAATQACQGVNGMVEHLFKVGKSKGGHPRGAVLIPVIFTTARLFTTDVDISTADIRSGNLSLPEESLEEKPWICLQYPVSVGLKHAFSPLGDSPELGDILKAEYTRSIPIVSAMGMEAFFTEFRVDLEFLEDCR